MERKKLLDVCMRKRFNVQYINVLQGSLSVCEMSRDGKIFSDLMQELKNQSCINKNRRITIFKKK